MELHLVDATYELFRAHYAPRPPVLGKDDVLLSGVSGLCDQLLYLLREEGATHVGCATDRVIESFRNDLYPGYKSSAGMPRDLLAQFPIAEEAIEALGLVLWPMVEFEADDAIAAAVERWVDDPTVERILVCTPDKDMAQLVRDERVVLWDRRRRIFYDDAAVRVKWGVAPESIPDWLALVGDAADGFPGIPGFGTKTAAALLAKFGHLEDIPIRGSEWGLPGSATPSALPRSCASGSRRRSCIAASPGCGSRPMAWTCRSGTPASSNGAARRGPGGRPSATVGGSNDSGTGPHRLGRRLIGS